MYRICQYFLGIQIRGSAIMNYKSGAERPNNNGSGSTQDIFEAMEKMLSNRSQIIKIYKILDFF
jgi:hypothetical protein